jgi:hypothetical protein
MSLPVRNVMMVQHQVAQQTNLQILAKVLTAKHLSLLLCQLRQKVKSL